jgi:NitT/TauT family transport system ATP-binding protein
MSLPTPSRVQAVPAPDRVAHAVSAVSSSATSQSEPASHPVAVSATGLSLAYDGRPVLTEISLQIRAGEFLSLVGPSGCGKTTLLNLVAGLIPHVGAGELSVAGRPAQLGRSDIAYMLARDSLLPWCTALENVEFGMRVRGVGAAQRRERARTMLANVGLGSYEASYPKALSHGMRQRVALARTFALDASILLMDEPFGALDAQTKLQLEDLLLTLCQRFRHTVVFVTHDLAEAVALSDRVVVLSSRPGRTVADVPIDLERPRSIRALQKSPRFHALYSQLWTHLENGWSRHEG